MVTLFKRMNYIIVIYSQCSQFSTCANFILPVTSTVEVKKIAYPASVWDGKTYIMLRPLDMSLRKMTSCRRCLFLFNVKDPVKA